jgi:hypothetical protein
VDCGFIDELDKKKNEAAQSVSGGSSSGTASSTSSKAPSQLPPGTVPGSVAVPLSSSSRPESTSKGTEDSSDEDDALLASAEAAGLLQQHTASRLFELGQDQAVRRVKRLDINRTIHAATPISDPSVAHKTSRVILEVYIDTFMPESSSITTLMA